ncbi:MAG TPA: M20 family metallopeptidase [Acidimicrobiales bacterium]|jgi:hippurate hydrolase|nr:M20 family metallopeptidase [Acidimicrobiales bacterium]
MTDAISPELAQELRQETDRLMDDVVAIRRRIHAEPELGLELPRTQELVADELARIGLTSVKGQSCTSLVAVLEGDREGPTTLLRADMDALAMPEDTGLEFASKQPGRMHACGHDTHTAMLLGATRILHNRRKDLAGRVVLMFQPGEEGYDGAQEMINDGLLTTHEPDRAFAIHISSVLPSGWVSTRPGTLMASADEFHITVSGRGGHASMPHDATDPIPVACQLVTSIQSMITRTVPAFDPAVVTVSMIHAGTATNVIPEQVKLGGTIRAVSDRSRDLVLANLADLVEHVAGAHGCTAVVEYEGHSYPVTVNDNAFAEHTLAVGRALVGDQAMTMPTPVMGAEDWSQVLRQVKGSMAFLGGAPAGVAKPAPNHSNLFMIDEAAMATGVAMYAAMAFSSEPA